MRKKLTISAILLSILILLVACDEEYIQAAETSDLFKSVLRNEAPFSFGGFGTMYLDEYFYKMIPAQYIAVFDLFDNGSHAVLLNLSVFTLVLFHYNGEILASDFGHRAMNSINRHGTFFWSGGSGSGGAARLELIGREINYVIVFGTDWSFCPEGTEGVRVYFSMYGAPISYAEYSELREMHRAKERISWHPFTPETIENLAAIKTPRA